MADIEKEVRDILEGDSKSELVEKLIEALDSPGGKVALIIGLRDEERKGLYMEVYQYGNQYGYELRAFIREGIDILEVQEMEPEEDE